MSCRLEFLICSVVREKDCTKFNIPKRKPLGCPKKRPTKLLMVLLRPGALSVLFALVPSHTLGIGIEAVV